MKFVVFEAKESLEADSMGVAVWMCQVFQVDGVSIYSDLFTQATGTGIPLTKMTGASEF